MLYNSKRNRILNYGILQAFFFNFTPLALLRYSVIQKEGKKIISFIGSRCFLYSLQYITRIPIIKESNICNYEIIAALILPFSTRILYNSNRKDILNYEILHGFTSSLAWF